MCKHFKHRQDFMTYTLIFIAGVGLLIIIKVVRRFLRAIKKPTLRSLPAEHARTVPMGAVDTTDYPAYTLQTHSTAYNMLYMPGNAALGAYSAGIACALQQKQEFHTVVGISSGALATLFLYGKDTRTLRQVLTSIDTRKILSLKPPLFSVLFGYSFADNSLLQSYLTHFVSDDFIDRLRSQHQLGYRGYVISHNIDTGDSVFWDLGAIASLDIPYAHRRQKLIRAVVASTALPMIFNPVHIPVTVNAQHYTQTHIDGAVSAHAVYADWMLPENMGDFTEKTITVAQSNTYYDTAPVQPTPWKMPLIGIKSLSNAYHRAYYASLTSTAIYADRHRMSVRINHIGEDTVLSNNNMDFSNRIINAYFTAGLTETKQNRIVWHDLTDIYCRV